MSFTDQYIQETITILNAPDAASIDAVAVGLAQVRDGRGRLFVLGSADLPDTRVMR